MENDLAHPLIGKVISWKSLEIPAEDIIILTKRIRAGENITRTTLSPRAELNEYFGMIIDVVGEEMKVLDFAGRKEFYFPLHLFPILTY